MQLRGFKRHNEEKAAFQDTHSNTSMQRKPTKSCRAYNLPQPPMISELPHRSKPSRCRHNVDLYRRQVEEETTAQREYETRVQKSKIVHLKDLHRLVVHPTSAGKVKTGLKRISGESIGRLRRHVQHSAHRRRESEEEGKLPRSISHMIQIIDMLI